MHLKLAESKMRKQSQRLILALFMLSLPWLISCGGDDGGFTEAELAGTWDITDASFEILIDGQDVLDWIINQTGASSFEARIVEQVIEEGISEGFEGTIIFSADGNYTTEFAGETDTGTWILTEGTIIMTSNQPGEVAVTTTIKTLNSNTLVIEITETGSEDFDQDSNNEELSVTAELTFGRQ